PPIAWSSSPPSPPRLLSSSCNCSKRATDHPLSPPPSHSRQKKSPCSQASTPSSKARRRSRKIQIQAKAFAGLPGSSQSSADGTGTHPPSGLGPSPSKMVFNNSMLSSSDGASEICACPSAQAGTQRELTKRSERVALGSRLRGNERGG